MKRIGVIFLLLLLKTTASAQVAVIAHRAVPVDSLKKSELVNIYTSDVKEWSDGTKILPKDLKDKEETRKVFYKYVGKSPSRMKSIWLKKLLAGESDPPETIPSEDKMLTKVASSPGAIGFVALTKVNNSVKTLLVIR